MQPSHVEEINNTINPAACRDLVAYQVHNIPLYCVDSSSTLCCSSLSNP